MCWTVTYTYTCGCAVTTTFQCPECLEGQATCCEQAGGGAPDFDTKLDEMCHECSELDDLTELAADLAVEGDRLVLPLQTSHLVNVLASRTPRARPLQPLHPLGE